MNESERFRRRGRTLDLPVRSEKPRKYGITSVIDLGIPSIELVNILESYHYFVDNAKLGIGSAYLEPHLKKKIQIYGEYGIPVYFGGTLFEKYYYQGKLDDFLILLNGLGITMIEVSCGTIDIKPDEMVELISRLSSDFIVFAEVGKKKEEENFSLKEWVSITRQFLEAGCDYAILEGRNTGDGGIYEVDGKLRKTLVQMIIEEVDHKRIVFEAPNTQSQSQLINLFGSNVNMGNVSLHNLLLVESQRQGFRSETFHVDR